jgi:hypothetical protein
MMVKSYSLTVKETKGPQFLRDVVVHEAKCCIFGQTNNREWQLSMKPLYGMRDDNN